MPTSQKQEPRKGVPQAILPSSSPRSLGELTHELRRLSYKLKGIAYYLGQPTDEETVLIQSNEAREGFGLIIEELGIDAYEIACQLADWEVSDMSR